MQIQEYYKSLAIAGIFFAIVAAIVFGAFFSERNLDSMRDEYNNLENRRVQLQSRISTLKQQNNALADITTDKFIHAQALQSQNGLVDFYSQVQKVFSDRNIEIISTRQQENSIILNLQGDYYALMATLADLRSMQTPSKINSMNIRRNQSHPSLIAADMILEALIAN